MRRHEPFNLQTLGMLRTVIRGFSCICICVPPQSSRASCTTPFVLWERMCLNGCVLAATAAQQPGCRVRRHEPFNLQTLGMLRTVIRGFSCICICVPPQSSRASCTTPFVLWERMCLNGCVLAATAAQQPGCRVRRHEPFNLQTLGMLRTVIRGFSCICMRAWTACTHCAVASSMLSTVTLS